MRKNKSVQVYEDDFLDKLLALPEKDIKRFVRRISRIFKAGEIQAHERRSEGHSIVSGFDK